MLKLFDIIKTISVGCEGFHRLLLVMFIFYFIFLISNVTLVVPKDGSFRLSVNE